AARGRLALLSRLGGAGGGAKADRAGQPGAAEAAVTERVLRQVLLVIVLGEVELGRAEDLGGGVPVALAFEDAVVRAGRGPGVPEAAEAEQRQLQAVGIRRRDRVAGHRVTIDDGHGLRPTRQRLLARWHRDLLLPGSQHGVLLA